MKYLSTMGPLQRLIGLNGHSTDMIQCPNTVSAFEGGKGSRHNEKHDFWSGVVGDQLAYASL